LQDIFALQDEIVQKIVTTLKLQLTLQEQGFIVRKHTDNLEAYDAFLRGQEYHYRFTKEANTQARQMFEKAVALDSHYADLGIRDAEIRAHAEFRKKLYSHDVVPEAQTLALSLN